MTHKGGSSWTLMGEELFMTNATTKRYPVECVNMPCEGQDIG